MTVHVFDDAWYAGMIEQHSPNTKDGVGRSLLVGFAMLAQSIDNLAKAVEKHGVTTGMDDVALSLDAISTPLACIADAIENFRKDSTR